MSCSCAGKGFEFCTCPEREEMTVPTKKKPLADPAPNTELRAALAGLVLQGMYANPSLSIGSPDGVFYVDAVREAVKAADLLIKELAK